MSDYITGELVRVGNFAEEEQPFGQTSLACAVVVMDREQVKLVRTLPMYDNVAIIRHAELDALQRENAALRADKERLNWLEQNLYTHENPLVEIASKRGRHEANSIRAAIDLARKEAQP